MIYTPRCASKALQGLVVVLCLLFSSALSQNMREFAEGVPLEITSLGGFQKLELPTAVYTVASLDLRDIRIFNSAEEAVPFAFMPQPELSSSSETRDLRFFSLTTTQESSQALRLLLETPDGSSLNVETSGGATTTQALSGYLLDVRDVGGINHLRLKWENNSSDFITEVSVEASEDLSSWQLLGKSVVAKLSKGETILQQNRLEFPDTSASYLKLSWTKPITPLSNIQTTFNTLENSVELRWLELPGTKNANTFTFETEYAAPFSSARFSLPEQSLVRATLRSKPAPEDPWTVRYEGMLYNLDGLTLTAQTFSETYDRYWQVVIDERDNLETLQLSLGFKPQGVLFLTKGQAPFTLAYGHATATSSAFAFAELLEFLPTTDVATIPVVKTGTAFTLAGMEALTPAPLPFPWRQVILWAVLILGVLFLVVLAIRLMKQVPPVKG